MSLSTFRRGQTCRQVGLLFAAWATAACSRGERDVVAYTSVDQVLAESVIGAFSDTAGVVVRRVFDTEETGGASVLNRVIAEASNPQADVLWSDDPVSVFVLIKRGLVVPYVSPAADHIPSHFKAIDGTWTGIAARARVLVVNTNRVRPEEMPRSIRDLANPRWKGQTAIANPLFGTTRMHVAALFTAWGDDTAKAFLNALKANGVRIANSNDEVRRLVQSGKLAFGLADTDDARAAARSGAAVRTVFPDSGGFGTLVLPTVTVLLKGAPHPAAAKRLIDHLVSQETEQMMANRAAYIPLGSSWTHTPGVLSIEQIDPMRVDYARVAETMERVQPWLRQWVGP